VRPLAVVVGQIRVEVRLQSTYLVEKNVAVSPPLVRRLAARAVRQLALFGRSRCEAVSAVWQFAPSRCSSFV
jgi:hypothetical protein